VLLRNQHWIKEMTDSVQKTASTTGQQDLQAEITRLNKIIQALMNRAERNASLQGSDFNLFQTAITLEDQVRSRTGELEAAALEKERIARDLRESENHYRLLVENSPMSIHEIDRDGRITSMSQAGLRMRGVKTEGEVQGVLYLDGVCAADRQRIAELFAKACAGKTSHFEYKASGSRGQIYKSCFVPIKNKNGDVEKLMGITEDITERKKAEELVRNFAFYDTLTQLANRRLLNDRLRQAMAASKRSGRYGAVLFLDLDNFKPLNDKYGHDMGDLLLVEVAHRIIRCVREIDTVARFGGDEFVVILSELDVDKELSIAQAGIIAEKIRITLAEPYWLNRNQDDNTASTVEHHCTASIGVVLFVNHETSPEDVLKWSDMAMYQAKDDGRNTVHLFGADLNPHG
jgi:diguanylate cyclase (GGDEF)-like protein/PAS domain S-box-containing protein